MPERRPAAFMSYVHSVDKHDDGYLTVFRERLEGEIRAQSGGDFVIFQDVRDIGWGERWRERIREALNEALFLIPIITPGFFTSDACREELTLFLEREKRLGRRDLILPLYYIEVAELGHPTQRPIDPLIKEIAERQLADWRGLRGQLFSSDQVNWEIAKLAGMLVSALGERRAPVPSRPDWSPDEPKRTTLWVNASGGPGRHRSIAEALAAAQAHSRIMVEPGVYKESLKITKPVEIIGDGRVDEIQLQVRTEPVIWFTSDSGRIANLTIRQTGVSFLWRKVAGILGSGVFIDGGQIAIETCDISSQGGACVRIEKGSAHLRGSRIHSGKEYGVVVANNASGVLEDNDIYDNPCGVLVGDAHSTLQRNRIYNNREHGVFVGKRGRGIFTDNEVSKSSWGILILEDADPTLRNNRVHDCQAGVAVAGTSRATLEDNDIYANAVSGVEIIEGGDPNLCGNHIHNNKQVGVRVYDAGRGTLERNDIYANLGGIAIESDGEPTLQHNSIHDNRDCGILIRDGGRGTLENNDIFGMPGGIAIAGAESNPTLRSNQIHGCKVGVLIADNGRGTLEDNDIYANTEGGVGIEGGGDPILRRNRIRDNKELGVEVVDNGRGTLEDNDIFGNEASVVIGTGGDPVLRFNRIHDCEQSGVAVGDGGRGTLEVTRSSACHAA